MNALLEPLKRYRDYETIEEKLISASGITQISGVIDGAKGNLIAGLGGDYSWKLVVTFSEQRARELVADLAQYEDQVWYYPAKDVLFYQSDIRGNLLTGERIAVMKQLAYEKRGIIVTTIDGLMDCLQDPKILMEASLQFTVGEKLNTSELKEELIRIGYEKNAQVEGVGQFAIRGGIIDIFPLSQELPFRIELWGDEIDTIRTIDVDSQRSVGEVDQALVYPAVEMILTSREIQIGLEAIEREGKAIEAQFRGEMKTEEAFRLSESIANLKDELLQFSNLTAAESYIRYFCPKVFGFMDYIDGPNTLILLDEPSRLEARGKTVELEFGDSITQRIEKGYALPKQADILQSRKQIFAQLRRHGALAFSTLDMSVEGLKVTNQFSLATKSVSAFNKSFELLVKELKRYIAGHYQIVVTTDSTSRAKRLAKDLEEQELPCFLTQNFEHPIKPGEILVCASGIQHGFEYPLLQFVVITESDVFGNRIKKSKKIKRYSGERIQDFTQLKVGDYVVHENHGLGVYRGIEKVQVDRVNKDYIKIEYDKSGSLFVPVSSLDVLQKYAGSDAKKPKLNRLGSKEWQKTKSRVRGAVQDIAKDLVELYATREQAEGFPYSSDTTWQREFEEAFPFEETDDQLTTIEAVKQDMESTRSMDRLVCGDVGFGKTEIAIRAAFKAVQEDKQVVYLVPTTILAQQHYNTFSQRMKDYPIRVDLLCRFKTAKEQRKTITDLKKGLVDIVIGTHRVLSKDVEYKDLGLLIIDEEQRFGVSHKEKIKQLKHNVDVLTLTATPIPRTLHMSLIGIRDMSVLEEAPLQRMPIQTYVMEHNEEMIREAVGRELARDGQVFYVYNRVKDIAEVTGRLQKLLPEATIAFAHGQMHERELEDIMYQFINGTIDVLVSTTIIETGLDISNVNTMIIQDADNMGLSQLYQLRGRVGRSSRTAYAFLTYRKNKMIREVAEKRLGAIKEFTELGSGIRIAMKDLEIRGAGNILGASQHGHMEAVGYDLYCKMLSEAVHTIQGDGKALYYETSIDLNLNAYIPTSYIQSEELKLNAYRKIATIENEEDRENMFDELFDRYGQVPTEVEMLLEIATLKSRAHEVYLTDVLEKGNEISFLIYPEAKYDPAKIQAFVQKFNGALKFDSQSKPLKFEYWKNYNTKTKALGSLAIVREVLESIEEELLVEE